MQPIENNNFLKKLLPLAIATAASIIIAQPQKAWSQEPTDSDEESSTVVYQAEFFDQYQPFSVNDMLARIPGINLARGGGDSRRGLGAGGNQVLINGRRVAGKGNEGNAQLSRIPATEVEYIEIIRGTSGDLDVRGGNQIMS